MSMNENLFDVLGVFPNASKNEIKSAYRKLAKAHHPDANPGNPEAEARFKEINAAYRALMCPEKRNEYGRRCSAVDADANHPVRPESFSTGHIRAMACAMRRLKKNPQAIRGAAHKAFEDGNFKFAAALLKQAVEAYPKRSDLYRDLAACLFHAKDFPDCARALRSLLSLCPDDVDAWFNLAYVKELDDDVVSAQKTIQKALERFPDHSELKKKAARLAKSDSQLVKPVP